MNATSKAAAGAARAQRTGTVAPCLACGGTLSPLHVDWAHRCVRCGLLRSELWDEERWQRKESVLNEEYRLEAIKLLRQQNAELIIQQILRHTPPATSPRTVCDVGCGYGWFGEIAQQHGMEVTGIEPEPKIAEAARGAGATVVTGCFPDCLAPQQRFDLITFNDVLEHIPAIEEALAACATHLNEGGVLSIAIPSSNGFFYRVATLLSRLGMHDPFDRMWQRSFHSPHIHYVNDNTLKALVTRHGFTQIHRGTLPTLTRKGLWSRLVMDGSQSRFTAALLWVILSVLIPVLSLLPADIILHLYRREGGAAGSASKGAP